MLCLHIRHPLTCVTLFCRGADSDAICRIAFGLRSRCDGMPAVRRSAPVLTRAAALIRGWLDGASRTLSSVPLDMDGFTAFQADVLAAARRIRRGTVASYAQLAAAAGHPAAVRAAAAVMRSNRYPIVIPCHRVVAAGARIGGFMGVTAGPAIGLKTRLLRMEGVAVANGVVVRKPAAMRPHAAGSAQRDQA